MRESYAYVRVSTKEQNAGAVTQKEAAKLCGMAQSTFCEKVKAHGGGDGK